jgi:signal transduction histidine kinase/CheY-like chemotaxis protein
MTQLLLKSEIRTEADIIWVRNKTRELSHFLGMDTQDQTRLATAVSEIARNAYQYGKGGMADFSLQQNKRGVAVVITIRDSGPGIRKLKEIRNGTYVSPQGMGVGLMGAERLVDEMKIETAEGQGTLIEMRKYLPFRQQLLGPEEIKRLTEKFLENKKVDPLEEISKQNHEILLTISSLNEKKDELSRLNQELEDTNRGVVALYAELDEKAESLRKANESKTSFLSDMTHEFRSPLNSILSISQILLEEAVEESADERKKQVQFIMKAAKGLSDLVNDLLDIAKIESGKVQVRTSAFTVQEIFSTLRGLMRPLGSNEKVELIFEDPEEDIQIQNDEGKITQILRNLISNAIKYTLDGEIRVSAISNGEIITFVVKDTGIGIPFEDQENIFSEFFQAENELQTRNKGTGLGLPLTKKLITLLGGDIQLKSEVHQGSEFKVSLPLDYHGPEDAHYHSAPLELDFTSLTSIKQKKRVLLIDDDPANRYLVAREIAHLPVEYREAQNGREGWNIARNFFPDIIILDLVMPQMDGYEFLAQIQGHSVLRNVPVVLYTSKDLDPEELAYFEQTTALIVQKKDQNYMLIKNAIERILHEPNN